MMRMENKRKKEIYGYVFVLAFSFWIIIECLKMKYISSKLLPLIFSVFLAVLALMGLIKEMRVKEKTEKEKDQEAAMAKDWGNYAITGSWMVGFLLSIYLVGFLVSICMFTILYTRWRGAKWPQSILFSGSITILVYIVFVVALKIDMYAGLLFKLLGS